MTGLSTQAREVRAKRIGASEVAAVLGISPFAGPFDVWARIVHGVEKEESPELTVGRYLESAVLDWYRDKTGHKTYTAAACVHDDHDWLSATPDAMFTGPGYTGLVECKTSRHRDDWGEDESDAVPMFYAAQAQMQMAVTNETRVDMPVLFTQAYQFGLYVLHRDQAVIDVILGQLGAWWERHIVRGEMPALDGGNAASEVLRRMFKGGKPAEVATPEEANLIRDYAADKAAEKTVDERLAVSRQRLVMAIGDRDGLTVPGGRTVTYRASKKGVRTLRLSGVDE